jgi:hypothetical protein
MNNYRLFFNVTIREIIQIAFINYNIVRKTAIVTKILHLFFSRDFFLLFFRRGKKHHFCRIRLNEFLNYTLKSRMELSLSVNSTKDLFD